MSRQNLGSKRTRGSKVVPVLGAAGLSLSLAGGASAAGAQVADALTHKAVVSHEITLGEEQIADVSLATFYVFDKENAGPSRSAAKSWRVAAGRALITRQEMMLIRPRFVRSRGRTGTRRSTFRKARGKHDQAQPPT
jgi:hypothetical protein